MKKISTYTVGILSYCLQFPVNHPFDHKTSPSSTWACELIFIGSLTQSWIRPTPQYHNKLLDWNLWWMEVEMWQSKVKVLSRIRADRCWGAGPDAPDRWTLEPNLQHYKPLRLIGPAGRRLHAEKVILYKAQLTYQHKLLRELNEKLLFAKAPP